MRWDDACLHHEDARTTTKVLLITRWNQKILVAGMWREYLVQ